MNWAIALPEIVLAIVAMAILIFGVLRREDTFVLSSMASSSATRSPASRRS
jgi:NADH:ubiquinone oxidoreductase subunit 2 (subunit N)